MKVESFFADRIHDALAAAHKQLGPEAVLLASHRASAESRHLGAFEVVCGCRETAEPEPASIPRVARYTAQSAPATGFSRDTSFIEELLSVPPRGLEAFSPNKRVETARSAVSAGLISWRDVELGLTSEGFPAALAGEITRGLKTEMRGRTYRATTQESADGAIPRRGAGTSKTHLRLQLKSLLPLLGDFEDPEPEANRPVARPWIPEVSSDYRELVSIDDVGQAIRSHLRSRLLEPPAQLRTAGDIRSLALVGPCGSGKTLLAIKIAVDASIRGGRPVRFVGIASSTPGSTRRMEAISALVGCPFSLVEKPQDLAGACISKAEGELLVIDTPGFSASQEHERRVWASALTQSRPSEVTLVMPATMKATDLHSSAQLYGRFRPTMLAFAHVDQTESLSTCLALAISVDLPVGYLSSGQEIPEDLETPSADEFLGRAAPVFQRELAWVS